MRIFRLLSLLCFGALVLSAQSTGSLDSLYLKNPSYRQLTGLWKHYRPARADVVMLGNSITAGAEWNELLGRPGVINRGISGDNLVGYLQRMEFVGPLTPRVCFIMGGINDLYAGYTPEQIFRNYTFVIDSLRSWKITPVVQSTLYVSPQWRLAEQKNQDVAKLNSLLEAHCIANEIDFLDLNARLADGRMLRDEYTTDGVHLTPAAYAIWAEELEPLLQKFGL